MIILSQEYKYKYGCLVQFGVSYMSGFSPFADSFLNEYSLRYNEISESGYSQSWENWQIQNSTQIMDLYDQLKNNNLIPTQPI